MKKDEAKLKLNKAMVDFAAAYHELGIAIDQYESDTNELVNDLYGFTEKYPFDKSYCELDVQQWVDAVVEGPPKPNFKVLNREYLNTGGNTMVGIHEVWLPEVRLTVYAYTNEEGCTLSLVDYIRNELDIDDYDELVFDYVDWGRITGDETYFELYRCCFNQYLVDDCQHFGYTRRVHSFLLSDELQNGLDANYMRWLATESDGLVETDGRCIITDPDYEAPEVDVALQSVKDFRDWHDSIAANEDYYNEWYTLEIHGKKVKLPFYAGVWNAVHDLLDITIEEW